MIKNKKDMKEYIRRDLVALEKCNITIIDYISSLLCPSIWRFEIKLRKTEYYQNCKTKTAIGRAFSKLKKKRLERYGLKLGFTIPINVFGPGLCLCHCGTIIVNKNCKIGCNARIHAGVNIGNNSRNDVVWRPDAVPMIGDNCYIGPGAKLYGMITIGDNVAIGANAVVNKDVESNTTVAGIPAKVINYRGSEGLIRK